MYVVFSVNVMRIFLKSWKRRKTHIANRLPNCSTHYSKPRWKQLPNHSRRSCQPITDFVTCRAVNGARRDVMDANKWTYHGWRRRFTREPRYEGVTSVGLGCFDLWTGSRQRHTAKSRDFREHSRFEILLLWFIDHSIKKKKKEMMWNEGQVMVCV